MTPPTRGSDIFTEMDSGHNRTVDDIRQKLAAIFKNDLFVVNEPILDDDELIADLGLDSANFAVALVVIQEQLRAAFTHEDIITCRTFGDLVTRISERRANTIRDTCKPTRD